MIPAEVWKEIFFIFTLVAIASGVVVFLKPSSRRRRKPKAQTPQIPQTDERRTEPSSERKKHIESYERKPMRSKYSCYTKPQEVMKGVLDDGLQVAQRSLLTDTEKKYLAQLRLWFADSCDIHTQISLSRLITVPDEQGNDILANDIKRFQGSYSRMSLDFVLYAKDTDDVYCIIELDDPSHQRKDRQLRDENLKRICSEAKLPFVQIDVADMHKRPALEKLVCRCGARLYQKKIKGKDGYFWGCPHWTPKTKEMHSLPQDISLYP